jgi:hypothetical protein
MPVRRFQRIEDMEQPVWREPGDPQLYRAIASLWDFGRRTRRRRLPPGVYRHASIEDLNAQAERWARDVRPQTKAPADGDSRG